MSSSAKTERDAAFTAFGGSDGGGRTLPATPRPSTSTSATSSYLTIRGLTDTFREQFVITHVTGEDTFEVRSSVNPRCRRGWRCPRRKGRG
jgi:hypothetical protein